MRIVDSNNLGNTNSAKTGRTEDPRSIDTAGKSGSAARKGSSGTDSVELSSLTDRISQTMQAAAASRSQRISELTAAVRSGSYQVDGKAISHALVNEAISSGLSGTP